MALGWLDMNFQPPRRSEEEVLSLTSKHLIFSRPLALSRSFSLTRSICVRPLDFVFPKHRLRSCSSALGLLTVTRLRSVASLLACDAEPLFSSPVCHQPALKLTPREEDELANRCKDFEPLLVRHRRGATLTRQQQHLPVQNACCFPCSRSLCPFSTPLGRQGLAFSSMDTTRADQTREETEQNCWVRPRRWLSSPDLFVFRSHALSGAATCAPFSSTCLS